MLYVYTCIHVTCSINDIILGELWQPGPGVCSESEDAVQRIEFRAGIYTCTCVHV